MKNKQLFIYALLFIALIISNQSYAQECIAAYDFGQGGTFYIAANPDENNSGNTNLIFDTPKNNQIAPWISTNFSTLGQSENLEDSNDQSSNLKIYVSGAWAPWGGDISKITVTCSLKSCDSSNPEDAVCLANGRHVYVEPDASNIPCILSQGWGLYGLIAIDFNNVRQDPNNVQYAKTLPSQYFRTFRVSPLNHDADGDFFVLKYTEQCDLNAEGQTVCVPDKDINGRNIIRTGTLYFKILDSYYQDNTGSYDIKITSGIAGTPGFVQLAIQYFTEVMKDVTKKLYISFTSDLGFISMVRAIVLLYVASSGFLFMLGLLRVHISELIVRLLKAGFIIILISQNSWDFFNTYLFSFFTEGAQSIATIITKSSFAYSSKYGAGQYILPKDANALTVYDNILKMLIHPSIHKKIWGLLIYKWYSVYLIFIYISMGIMIVAVVRSVVIYITSILLITLLLVISPLFLVMMLFKLTKEFFDTWLKQLLVNALMLIVISASIALMINLILNQFENLLYYKVCWENIWTLNIAGYDIFHLWFWHPSEPSQLDTCITPAHFFSYLMICILFNAFMQQIPELIDTLAASGLMPLTTMFKGVTNTFQHSKVYKKVSSIAYQARSIASISAPIVLTKTGQRFLSSTDVVSTVTDKFSRAAQGGGSGASSTQIFKGARDFVGGKIEAAESLVTPKNRGIFD